MQLTKSFYKDQYSSKENMIADIDLKGLLSDEDLNKFGKRNVLLTHEELSLVLKQTSNNKSPGGDGFNTEFLKVFWKNIGYCALDLSFTQGELPITQKLRVLTCISKDDKPRSFWSNWRLISLSNVIYKLASACIPERLKRIMHSPINEHQTRFIFKTILW